MAAEAAIKAGKKIISASGVVEFVKNYAVSFAKEEFKGLWDLRKNVTELSKTLESIQADLKVAEERQDESEDIRKWLQKLKNVAYDLEDVLDDYALEGLADEENMGAIRRAINSLWLLCDVPLSCFGIATPVTPLRNIAHSLQPIKEKLEEVNKKKESLAGGASSSGTATSEATTSVPDRGRPMVGRYETKTQIKTALLNAVGARVEGSSPKTTVVGIAGFGGMGKTTLAQDIFNDQELVEKFSFRKWVHVGENFDITRLMNDIIGDGSQLQDLSGLQSTLIGKIKKDRFLIVLDNAWCTDGKEWEKLWRPLTHGEEGGAIVVTARDQTVARAIAHGPADSEHLLGEMPEEECLEILKRSALKGQKPEGHQYHHREWQCKQIVKKLKGVPLAADIMGRFLGSHMDKVIWKNVVADEGWSQEGEEELVHRVTGLSYRHLPSHLKPCFAYCSIFPKGFRFDRETLVQMWIAQGYIQPRDNQLEEHTGIVYFDDLCQMSFFQLDKSDDRYYVMHDLVNDFAQKIFPEGRGRIVAGDGDAPEQVRHVSLHLDESDSTVFQNLQKYKKLRTLMIYAPDITAPALDVLGEFKYMRVLVLKCRQISEFPESIGHLKLLRYLDISGTSVPAFPELVCGLLHLQVLKRSTFCELPEGTSKLVNLQCLGVEGYLERQLVNLQHIGRLTSLQELESFYVRKNRGFWIDELGSLNNLHKALRIRGLENVQSKDEALLAKLKDKVHLEELQLDWGYEPRENVGEEQRSIESQVLEGLCPPPNLKTLLIRGNLGAQPPSWMMERHLLPSSLVHVWLYGCRHWECLPALGQLPLLTRLGVDGAEDLKKVGQEFFCATDHCAFPRLEYLLFSNMKEWEGWDYMPRGRVFPSLRELKVEHCPKLASLSPLLRHMTTLTELSIYDCAQLSSLEEDGGDWMFASLRRLKISFCPKLTSLSPMLRDLTALQQLDIQRCDQLSSLLVPPILPFLSFLRIESCPMLKELATLPSSSQKQQEENDHGDQSLLSSSFPRLKELNMDNMCHLLKWILPKKLRFLKTLEIVDSPGDLTCFTEAEEEGWTHLTSLTNLTFRDCPHLQTLPSSFHTLPSLVHLGLKGCPEINHLPEGGLPASLQHLYIIDCSHLQTLPSSLHTLPSLAYLKLECCPEINRLPEGGLPASLQHLYIIDCPHLQTLPSSFHTLPSLVYLELKRCPEILRLPEGGLPASLQKLHITVCPHLQTLPSNLHTLPSLGQLYLKRCPEINHLPEGGLPASLQNLFIIDCPHLQTLPSSLHTLTSLVYFKLKRCPEINCLPEEGLPASLQELYIIDCPHLQTLPSSLHTLPSLVRLELKRCHEINRLPERALPASLQELHIIDCSHLQTLPSNLHTLPSLGQLYLKRCPEINRLSEGGLPASLRYLYIIDCPHLQTLPSSLHTLPSLVYLQLERCPEINHLPEGGLPASLQKLHITDCPHLQTLPERALPTSLQELYIIDCPHLQTLPERALPASLQELSIIDCPHLQTLPSSFHTLPSLVYLELKRCPEINRLPEGGLPASLQTLHIIDCPQLAESCREGGPDHHKIHCDMEISMRNFNNNSDAESEEDSDAESEEDVTEPKEDE